MNDRRERRRKKKKIRLNIGRLIVVAIVVILVGVTSFSVKKIVNLKMEQNQLKSEQTSLKEKKEKLEDELKHIDSESYIEEQARKQLNMIKPGEILYMIEKDKAKDKKSE
ncbi:MAG: cell division protein FtsL [Hornefia sp.]|nr:cell division protein FtsL [Hornefia sp.]